MMDVDVDDRDTVETLRERVRGGHGDVVVETESHRAIALGVVPGGRTSANAASPWRLHAPPPSRSRRRRACAISADSGEVKVSGSSITPTPEVACNRVEVLCEMHAAQFLARRQPRRRGSAAAPLHRAAAASNTCARSIRSGCPGGVTCSSNRGEVISSINAPQPIHQITNSPDHQFGELVGSVNW